MSLAARLKRPVTALLDRAADRIAARVSAALGPRQAPTPEQSPAPLYRSFHDLLHAQRSVELSRMPKPARVPNNGYCYQCV